MGGNESEGSAHTNDNSDGICRVDDSRQCFVVV